MPLQRLLFVLALLLSPMLATAQKYPPSGVEMELVQVAEHSFYVQGMAGAAFEHEGFISNAGVVITDDGVVLIDALGSPSLAQKLMQVIRKHTDKPVVKVLVTHYHADHILGLQYFKDLGAEIISPSGSEKYLESDVAQQRLEERRFSLDPWVNDDTRLVWPDQYVDASLNFEFGGVRFITTVIGDAHSDADMNVYVENDKVLYSGDVIFEGRVPFLGSTNTALWLQVLDEMQSSDLAALVPGHGPHQSAPVTSIGMTHHYLKYLRETMGAAVEELIPFDEVYSETDWSEFKDLPAFDLAHRRNAYQVFLSMEKELLAE